MKIPKRQLNINIPVTLHEAIEIIANETGVSMTAWALMALRNAVRNWDSGLQNNKRRKVPKKPKRMEKWDSNWLKSEKCWVCSKLHDPLEHASVSEEDIELMMKIEERER